MDSDKDKEIVVTPEEEEAEKLALKETPDEELRDKLAEEYGIDPDTEADMLDKLVKREKEHRTKLSGAIKQKIKYRETLKGAQPKPPATPAAGTPQTPAQGAYSPEEVDKRVNERLEQRDLEELALPEEIEKEVKDLAKLKGISVRKAAQLPYITSLKKEHEEAERINNATPTRKGKGSYAATYDPSKGLPDPSSFALDTEEGRKAWNEAKQSRRDYEAKKK